MSTQTPGAPASNDRTWLTLAVMGMGVVGGWHVALAAATPGHGVRQSAATVAALLRGNALAPETATGPTNVGTLVTVLVLEVLVGAGLVTAWLVWKPRKGTPGLASAARASRITTSNDAYRQLIGHEGRKPVYIRSEHTGLLIAPPRSGKTTGRVVAAVLDAPGACVTTSTKVEVLRLTHALRATKGRVLVFDPEGLSQWPNPMTWDIVAGCEDPVEATERARAMVRAVPNGEGGNIQFFERAAGTILAIYMHAAALGGHTMERVVAWSKNTRNQEPYKILEDSPSAAPNWRDQLEQLTRGDAGPTIQSTMMTLSNVLDALRTGPALTAVSRSSNGFNVEQFLDSTDTLYLLSEGGEGSAAPLTTALVATIERRARVRSQRTLRGRFDVPLTLVLDEAPNIAALPSLPSLMTDSGGRGVIVWVVSQSYAQLRSRWGDADAQTILNGAAALLVLGGIKEVDLLDQLTRLAGERRVQRHTHSQSREGGSSTSTSSEWEQVLRFDDVRGLPQGQALLWYLAFPPARITITPWWKRPDAKAIRESEHTAHVLEGFIQ